ncbi:MAG: NAD-dependent succinate-semialdehyde dehydrogenase [Fidelibacterota bacterium]
MALVSINPATGEKLRTYEELTWEAVGTTLTQAQEAFLAWRETSFDTRTEKLNQAAAVLRKERETYGRLMAEEMGKPTQQALAEVDKCAWVCEYYAEHGATFLADQPIATDASKSYVTFQPLGIILAIMPWNFPFWQVFRFAAPTLMAGNAGLLKHASNVQGCAQAIESIFQKAGFPENIFRNLALSSSNIAPVITHPLIQAVTLTGSTPAGKSVAALAGGALKKTVLELGGSDPYVILKDADLEAAARACLIGRMINTGQSCIAAKRLIVVEAVRETFEELIVELMSKQTMGNPLEEEVDIGPMVNIEARDELHEQVQRSVSLGAKLKLGGFIPDGPGAFYPPTVLTEVVPGMPAFDEELFGPVAVIIAARDAEEALRLANATTFGLGAAVFTGDVTRGEHLAAHTLEAGCCFVNDFVRSDPRLPFGGMKQSGYGRELSSFGILEFVNIKTVYVR